MSESTAPRASAFVDRVRQFLARYPKGGALFFTKRVNRTTGAVLSVILIDTPVTPNMVSVAGLAVHLLAAGIVVTAPAPFGLPGALLIVLLWQLAFGLDCADGQLARARKQATPFGAWLDIFIDVLSHVVVYGALSIYVVRALALEGVAASALTTVILGLHLFQLFTSWERGMLGTEPALRNPPPWVLVAMRAEHLLDYGWFLFAAAVFLPWPVVLTWFLVASALLHAAAALIQLGLNWRNQPGGGDQGQPDGR